MKSSRTLPGVRKVEYRVGVRGQCLWKVFLFSNSSSYRLSKSLLRILFCIMYFYPLLTHFVLGSAP
jgi:hypothetical protein